MRITCWLTVLVTVERCMCLVMPLKVKKIFTPRFSTIMAVLIFVFFLLTQTFNILGYRLDWKFLKAENRSRIGVVPTKLLRHTRPVTLTMNIILQFLSLTAILISNFTLLHFLRKKISWRNIVSGRMNSLKETGPSDTRRNNHTNAVCGINSEEPREHRCRVPASTSRPANALCLNPKAHGPRVAIITTNISPGVVDTRYNNSDQSSSSSSDSNTRASIQPPCTAVSKDQKLCRMILLISALMTIAYLPSTICLALGVYFKEFGLGLKLSNSFIVAYSITFVFEATNASVNIFLYYMMSSNYRRTLDNIASGFWRRTRRVGDVGPHPEGAT
ncbi:hypothetical protein EGW08_013461 [Elysia chlorotica]|uniref:G-protein coupled receptors family 1 profile domain-containing protein n=1 Tax=Elysia chlorotica TaxID=188477 RepID=A0A3S0ZN25_ELYCH|nr:hypothetical protein EGW08_013461 [Elysia chlorotica]